MVLGQLCGRLKIILLSIIGAIRRSLCCFSRRRKPSENECEILQSVNVVRDTGKTKELDRDWNSWDDSPRTVQEHIDQYRQRLARPPTPKEPEPDPDFFQDMTPKIKPQTKILIQSEPEVPTDFSRLKALSDIPIEITPDLQDWVEDDQTGWEGLDKESTKQLIREKRKEMRAQRQTRVKDPSIAVKTSPTYFAERVSSVKYS